MCIIQVNIYSTLDRRYESIYLVPLSRLPRTKTPPDKVKEEDKAAAHTTFQRIALAYAVLSTPHRRARYDATGRTDDSLYPGDGDDDGPFDWQSFYRAQFENAVTDATIENARNGYVGTEEEKADLLKAYEKVKGDMARIYQLIMFAEPWEDEERFRVIIDAAIKNEEVTGWGRYMMETPYDRERRIARAKRMRDGEAKELEDEKAKKAKKAGGKKGAQEFKVEGFGDLAAMIQQRQKARSGFFDRLEEAYTPASRGKKRQSEPPEEAFAAMGERMKKKRKQSEPDEAEEDSEEAEEESEEEKPRPRRRLGRKKT